MQVTDFQARTESRRVETAIQATIPGSSGISTKRWRATGQIEAGVPANEKHEEKEMSKNCMKPVAAAVGAAFAGSMLLAGAASAANSTGNPFGLSELSGGYAQLAEGKCGAGKCGAGKCGGTKSMEGKCGAGKCGGAKSMEGKCGAGKCGGAKSMEGKCGAGKCGGSK
jgi:uncharacterized low-complexity protein